MSCEFSSSGQVFRLGGKVIRLGDFLLLVHRRELLLLMGYSVHFIQPNITCLLLAASTELTFDSTLRNSQQSPLLSFPAELRNAIYAYVLTESPHAKYMFKPYWDSRWEECAGALVDARIHPHRLALLATCRQIYSETYALPFILKTPCYDKLNFLAANFLGLLPHQRNNITRIKITDLLHHVSMSRLLGAMKQDGKHKLRCIFPNARNVTITCSYFSHVRDYQELQRGAYKRLVAWLEGPSGDGKVVVTLNGRLV
jgi:hypothetical protein